MPTNRDRYSELDKNGQSLSNKGRPIDAADLIRNLCSEIPCREKQITQLVQLIGMSNERLPPSIFVHGLSSTGKTLVISRLLAKRRCRHAVVSCECAQTSKLLFEPILNSLTRHTVRSDNDFEAYGRCDSTWEFVKNLKIAAAALNFTNEQLLIVLENCEQLRSSKDANLLQCLVHLQEFTEMNVCVVFSTDVSFDSFVSNLGQRPPIIIHFPQYTQGEFLDVLLANFSEDSTNISYPQDFKRDYLAILVRVYYRDCRNLRELQRLARLHFGKYCEPVESGEVTINDPKRGNKLWRQLRPHIGNALENLQFRSKPSCQPVAPAKEAGELTFTESWALAYELPYYTKYLLVAAYLASYNPEKSDQRVFFKALNKQKKRKLSAAMEREKQRDQTLGPKFFALDRLFAIFYAVIDEELSLTVNLQAQISSLVKLELLVTSGDNFVDSPKLQCTVSLDFIKAIARNLGFEVERYIFNLN